MGSKAIETATSLEKFLNRHVLFIQGIDQSVPKSEVLQVLNQVLKQPQQGRIDILTHPDGKMRGSAFLNFHNTEDANAALEKWRFTLELRGRPLRMQFSSDREFKDVILGPLMNRFKILIKNLPEELPPEALFKRFSDYGEIIQLYTACDHYGQHYAIIQYVEVASVHAAIRNAHRERVLNNVLAVEPFKSNTQHVMLPRNINQTSPPPQLQAPPAAAAATIGAVGAASRSGGLSSTGSLQGTTYAALQQQQAREMEEQERYAFMEHSSDAGSAGTAPPPPPPPSSGPGTSYDGGNAAAPDVAASIAVANFFAATTGPAQAANAPGSLSHLLSTALDHVKALEEQLVCPITQELLVDPVVAADGNTYERLAITAWLAKNDTSPLTNEVLLHKALTPNNLVRKLAEEVQGICRPSAEGGGGGKQHGTPLAAAGPQATAFSSAGDAAVAALPPPPPAAAATAVETPVPVPVGIVPMSAPYNPTIHHAIPPPPQQQHQHQQHPHYQHQHQQLHQYGGYAHLPGVLRSQLMPAPVAFVHVPQPQQFQVPYRPVGM